MKPTLSLPRFLELLEQRDWSKISRMYHELYNDYTTLEAANVVQLATRKASQPIREEVSSTEFPTYAITSGGRLWKNGYNIRRNGKTYRHSCGWQEFDKTGKEIGSPIGHTEFRKKPLAKKTDSWIRLCRPEGTWRRYIDCLLSHELYGNGKVLVTDGHHALFEFTTSEGQTRRVEVIFANLNEVAVPTVRKEKSVNSVKKTREVKVSANVLDLL